MPAALPYKKAIANRIRKMIRDGVAMKDIMVSIQELQDAPSSFATFYKTYGQDIAQERSDIVGQVGNVVVQQALDGDFKSQNSFSVVRVVGPLTPLLMRMSKRLMLTLMSLLLTPL